VTDKHQSWILVVERSCQGPKVVQFPSSATIKSRNKGNNILAESIGECKDCRSGGAR
jgi:hypothetical protein